MNNENVKKLANAPKAENEIYVGPDWINETGKRLPPFVADPPLVRVPRELLTEEEIVERETHRQYPEGLRSSTVWLWLAPGLIALACAWWLFDEIWKALQP